MILRYKETAIEDIRETERYIAEKLHNKTAAKELTRKILDAGSLLKENPYMGAALSGKVDYETDLRFLVVSRQLMFYRVCDEVIEITRVLDGRQDYLAILF